MSTPAAHSHSHAGSSGSAPSPPTPFRYRRGAGTGDSLTRKLFLATALATFYGVWTNIFGDFFLQRYNNWMVVHKFPLGVYQSATSTSAGLTTSAELILLLALIAVTMKVESCRLAMPLLGVYLFGSWVAPGSLFPLFLASWMVTRTPLRHWEQPRLAVDRSVRFLPLVAFSVTALGVLCVLCAIPRLRKTPYMRPALYGLLSHVVTTLWLSWRERMPPGAYSAAAQRKIRALFWTWAVIALVVVGYTRWPLIQSLLADRNFDKHVWDAMVKSPVRRAVGMQWVGLTVCIAVYIADGTDSGLDFTNRLMFLPFLWWSPAVVFAVYGAIRHYDIRPKQPETHPDCPLHGTAAAATDDAKDQEVKAAKEAKQKKKQ